MWGQDIILFLVVWAPPLLGRGEEFSPEEPRMLPRAWPPMQHQQQPKPSQELPPHNPTESAEAGGTIHAHNPNNYHGFIGPPPPPPLHPYNHDDHDTANNLLLDFLYDYYEFNPYGHGGGLPPPDFGWVRPSPHPPSTTPGVVHPIPEEEHGHGHHEHVMPAPHHPHPHKPSHGHGEPETDKDTTDEDQDATDEDEDEKTTIAPSSLLSAWNPYNFAFWRPPGIGSGSYTKGGLDRLKEKWNRLMEMLKIRESWGSPEGGGGGNKNTGNRPMRPPQQLLPAGGSQFQLEQLPGWNRPPLRNPNSPKRHPYKEKYSNWIKLNSDKSYGWRGD